jgi:hypothetical protein
VSAAFFTLHGEGHTGHQTTVLPEQVVATREWREEEEVVAACVLRMCALEVVRGKEEMRYTEWDMKTIFFENRK